MAWSTASGTRLGCGLYGTKQPTDQATGAVGRKLAVYAQSCALAERRANKYRKLGGLLCRGVANFVSEVVPAADLDHQRT